MRMTKHRSDEGSVAVIVGIVMAVLTLPLLVLVLDGGGLFGERRQLQNDADAAALAAAQYCSSFSSCDPASAFAKAASLVNANDDSTGAFDAAPARNRGATFENTSWYLCGTAISVTCDPVMMINGQHSKADCPEVAPSLPDPQTYVQVRVISGGTGWSGFTRTDETPVFACSRAIINGPHVQISVAPGYTPPPMYSVKPSVAPSVSTSVSPGTPAKTVTNPGSGAPSSGTVLAVTMSLCDWEFDTANGTHLGSSYVVDYDFSKPRTDCVKANVINASAKGGLSGAKNICPCPPSGQTTISTGNVGTTSTGDSSTWKGVGGLLANSVPGTKWLVPIYDASGGTGSSVYYNITGFAAFVVTDWNFGGGMSGGSQLANSNIRGYFTTAICSVQLVCSGSGGGQYGVTPPSYTTYPATSPLVAASAPPL